MLDLMLAAAYLRHTGAARQLLLVDAAEALNMAAEWTDLSPFHQAAFRGQAAVLRQLLEAAPAGAAAAATCRHLNEGEYAAWTLMHSAAVGGSAATIQVILDFAPGAASWASDYHHTPLHEACGAGHREAARLLLDAAPTTAAAKDDGDFFPLHWAALEGDEEIINLLLAAGAPGADQRNDLGNTPLHCTVAFAAKPEAAVKLLLDACPAAALVPNDEGQLPLDCALCRYEQSPEHLSIARLLLPVSGPVVSLGALKSAHAEAQPLYADLAALFALSAAEWERVPAPCTGLGRALPAVLERSDAEARQLVRRLSLVEQQRLRTAALPRASCGAAAAAHHGAMPGRLIACKLSSRVRPYNFECALTALHKFHAQPPPYMHAFIPPMFAQDRLQQRNQHAQPMSTTRLLNK